MSLATVNPRVREKLIETARAGTLISYWELGHACDIDHHFGLHSELGKISRDCHQRGEPLLSALVVSKEKNMPSGGFFEQAMVYEGYGGNTTEGDQRRWWKTYLAKVRSYHWQSGA